MVRSPSSIFPEFPVVLFVSCLISAALKPLSKTLFFRVKSSFPLNITITAQTRPPPQGPGGGGSQILSGPSRCWSEKQQLAAPRESCPHMSLSCFCITWTQQLHAGLLFWRSYRTNVSHVKAWLLFTSVQYFNKKLAQKDECVVCKSCAGPTEGTDVLHPDVSSIRIHTHPSLHSISLQFDIAVWFPNNDFLVHTARLTATKTEESVESALLGLMGGRL